MSLQLVLRQWICSAAFALFLIKHVWTSEGHRCVWNWHSNILNTSPTMTYVFSKLDNIEIPSKLIFQSSPVNKKPEKRADSRTTKTVHKAPPNPPFKPSSKAFCKAPPKTPVRAGARAAKSPKSAKVSKALTAKRRNEKDPITVISFTLLLWAYFCVKLTFQLDAETPLKKPRKGYVYELIPPLVQHVNVNVLEMVTFQLDFMQLSKNWLLYRTRPAFSEHLHRSIVKVPLKPWEGLITFLSW